MDLLPRSWFWYCWYKYIVRTNIRHYLKEFRILSIQFNLSRHAQKPLNQSFLHNQHYGHSGSGIFVHIARHCMVHTLIMALCDVIVHEVSKAWIRRGSLQETLQKCTSDPSISIAVLQKHILTEQKSNMICLTFTEVHRTFRLFLSHKIDPWVRFQNIVWTELVIWHS